MTTIIIADDHPIIISGVEALLRGSDYVLAGKAANGAQALAAVAKHRPDMMIMDVSMPVCSGLEALRTLRARQDDLPVIFLTANLDHALVEEAVALQVNGIVLKDTAAESLLICLDQVRSGKRWIDPALSAAPSTAVPSPSFQERERLSERELEVAQLVSRGLRNREIAAELGITEGTVKLHLHRIYEKLDISSRTELVILARGWS